MRYRYTPEVLRQKGRGLPVFSGEIYQRGYGFGGLLASLARRAIPFLAPLAKTVGRSLLKTGGKVAHDVIVERKNLKNALRQRGVEAISELLESPQTRPEASPRSLTKKKRRSVGILAASKRKKVDILD